MYTYKILLVDDNPILFHLWHSILSQVLWQYKLDWAVSEISANKLIEKKSYDIIISDVILSGSRTGVDLWKTVDTQNCSFVFSTDMKAEKFVTYLANEDRPYFLVEKPLNIGRCMQFIHQLTRADLRFKTAV